MYKAVFLDRDGTINEDRGYVYRIEDFSFIPGVMDGLRLLQDAGYLLIVVTNQSGIARGMYTEADYYRLMQYMYRECEKYGVHITADYFCPHHPQAEVERYKKECDCRKPKAGLLLRAAKEYDIDLKDSWMIGDSERDMKAGKTAGCKTALIVSGKEQFFRIAEAIVDETGFIMGGVI